VRRQVRRILLRRPHHTAILLRDLEVHAGGRSKRVSLFALSDVCYYSRGDTTLHGGRRCQQLANSVAGSRLGDQEKPSLLNQEGT